MIPVLGDHVWQSTLFAGAAALLTAALHANRAGVRYWIWLAASIKFLVPFAALAALGRAAGSRWAAPVAPADMTLVLDAVSQPFSQPLAPAAAVLSAAEGAALPFSWAATVGLVWLAGVTGLLVLWFVRWQRVAAIARAGTVLTGGREPELLRRLGGRLPIVACDGTLEPGVFGIVRPVLLWPRGISAHLDDDQVAAILAHELVHLRRGDNLTAALHMVVQALCWFHPVVWWIGARLVRERERACDEHVLHSGGAPQVYAESILKTCEFSIESPLTCVPGVTGADLKRRIEDIMRNRAAAAMSSSKKLLVITAAFIAIAGPVAVGGLNARPLPSQAPSAADETVAFDVASIKPNHSGDGRVMMRMLPGGAYEATNVTMRALIQQAHRMSERQVIGGPSWLETERFDILAKAPQGALQAQFPERLRTLLLDRLSLKAHRETREMPIYALVLARDDARLGPQITPTPMDCSPGAAPRGRANAPPAATAGAGGRQQMPMPAMPPLGSEPRPCGLMISPTGITGGGQTMAGIANALQNNTGRIVHDRTGLSGSFDFDLRFTPDPGLRGRGPGGGLPPQPGAGPGDSGTDAVSIFTAVQEQLGLRLESTTGPVEVLVIDSVERPTEN